MAVWLEMRDPNFYRNVSKPTAKTPVKRIEVDQPCPTVMASGIRSSTAFIASDAGPVPAPPLELLVNEPDGSPCPAPTYATETATRPAG